MQKTTLPNSNLSKRRRPLYQTAQSQNPEEHTIKPNVLKTQKSNPPNNILSKPRKQIYQTALSQNPGDTTTKQHALKKPEDHSTK